MKMALPYRPKNAAEYQMLVKAWMLRQFHADESDARTVYWTSGLFFWGFFGAFLSVGMLGGLLHWRFDASDGTGAPVFKFLFWNWVFSWGIAGLLLRRQIEKQRAVGAQPNKPRDNPYGEVAWATPEDLQRTGAPISMNGYDPAGILLGIGYRGAPCSYTGEGSVVTFGPIGSGKLHSMVVQNALTNRGSAIFNDPKGECAAITAPHRATFSKVHVLNPFDVLKSVPWMKTARFNPLVDLDPESKSFSSDCAKLASALVLIQGKDPHWSQRARDFMTALVGYVCWSRSGPARNLPQITEIIFADDEDFGAEMQLMSECPYRFVANAARPFLAKERPRSLNDVLETLRGQVGTFLNNDAIADVLSGDDFSFADLKKEPTTLYIVLPPEEAHTFSRFTRLVYAMAINKAVRGERKPLYMSMDELATSLGGEQLELIDQAMNIGRGFGLRMHLYFQNVAQLKSIFGENSDSVLSAAGVKQYYRVADDTTFEHLQKSVGNTTLWLETESASTGWHQGTSAPQDGRGGSTSTGISGGTSTSEQALDRPFITRKLAFETLGKPSAANNWTAQQVLIVDGTAEPMLISRKAYFVTERFKALAAPNPYIESDKPKKSG